MGDREDVFFLAFDSKALPIIYILTPVSFRANLMRVDPAGASRRCSRVR